MLRDALDKICTFIRQGTHVTLPPSPLLHKLHKRIDIRPAPSASGDVGSRDQRDRDLSRELIPKRGDEEPERNAGLVENGGGVRDGIDRASLVFRIRIGKERLVDSKLFFFNK